MMKIALENRKTPVVNWVCGKAYLELGKDSITWSTLDHFLLRIVRKPIVYKNSLPMSKPVLLSQSNIKYIEDIIITRDTVNLGMSRQKVVQEILEIVQASSYAQT